MRMPPVSTYADGVFLSSWAIYNLDFDFIVFLVPKLRKPEKITFLAHLVHIMVINGCSLRLKGWRLRGVVWGKGVEEVEVGGVVWG